MSEPLRKTKMETHGKNEKDMEAKELASAFAALQRELADLRRIVRAGLGPQAASEKQTLQQNEPRL